MPSKHMQINLLLYHSWSYSTMSPQYKSNTRSVSFICVIADLFLCNTKDISRNVVLVSTRLCLMSQTLYQHEPSAGFMLIQSLWHYCMYSPSQHDTLTQCWFNVGRSSATLAKHWANIGPVYDEHNLGILVDNCVRSVYRMQGRIQLFSEGRI